MLIELLFAAAHWLVVREDTVKPPLLMQYANVAKDRGGMAIALNNLHYLTLADVDSLDAANAIAQQWFAPDAIETRSVAIWRLRPDLSYEPAQPRLKREEEGFVHFDVYAFLPGHQAEAEALTKQFVAIDRDAGVKHRWEIYEVVIGSDMPAFVQATPARTRADFEGEKVAADALRANRDMPLRVRDTDILRHIASFEGAIRR